MPPITSGDVLIFLGILVGIMIVVVLYHLLFIVVDVRRVIRRVDTLTEQVESIVLKPLAIADQALSSIVDLFEKGKKSKGIFHKKNIG